MNINNLKTFCLVAEKKNVSEVARINFISQPAVTRQIKQLEEEYETLLFHRGNKEIYLTKAGEILYPLIKEIVYLYTYSFEHLNSSKKEFGENITIGASLTIGEYLLPKIIKIFKTKKTANESINFILSIGNTPNILQLLKKDSIDIALIESEFEEDNFVKEKFAEDRLVLVCNNQHKLLRNTTISLKDLPLNEMIWREKNSGLRKYIEDIFIKNGIHPKINESMIFGSLQSIKSAVQEGLGISILPESTVEAEVKFNVLSIRELDETEFKRNLYLVYKRRKFNIKSINEFKTFMLKDYKLGEINL